MTVAEIELLSKHQPDVGKKKKTMGMLDPEHKALQDQLAYMQLSPREKINKRLRERE